MNAQLRSTYLYVFTTAVIFSAYAWWVFGVLGVAHFTGPDELVRIGAGDLLADRVRLRLRDRRGCSARPCSA